MLPQVGRSSEVAVAERESSTSFQRSQRGAPNRQQINMYANFVKLISMTGRDFYQYLVDFEPNIESLPIRKRLFIMATENVLEKEVALDGMHDAGGNLKVEGKECRFNSNNPANNSPVSVIKCR